jgi:BASS family bile acid:Na+ symporter
MVLNLLTLGLILAVHFAMLIGVPFREFIEMLALVLPGVAAGWLLSRSGREDRTAMVMATTVRNVGVSLVIATGNFPGTPAVTAVTAFALFQTIVMALVALGWGRWGAAREPGVSKLGSQASPLEPVTKGTGAWAFPRPFEEVRRDA